MREELNREAFHDAIDETLSGLHENPFLAQRVMAQANEKEDIVVKKRLSVGFMLVAVLMLLAVAAMAVTGSYVLQYLRYKDSIHEEDIHPIDQTFTDEDVLIHVVDSYYDGESLSVGMEIRSEAPAYLTVESIYVNGNEYDLSESNIEDMWVSYPPEIDRRASTDVHGFTICFDGIELQGPSSHVEMHLSLLVPTQKVCLIETESENHMNSWRNIDEAIQRGETPVDSEEPFQILVGSEWFGDDMVDINGPVQRPVNASDAYVDASNMTLLSEQLLSFDVMIHN